MINRTPHRRSATLWQMLNPLWWCCDTLKDPGWSTLGWFIRNPMMNLFSVIIGVSHLYRTTVCTNTDDTFPEKGWQFGLTAVYRFYLPLPIYLPLIAYQNNHIELATGWQMNGCFTILTLRTAGAKNATETRSW